MIGIDEAMRLMRCFPGSYIDQNGEFIAAPKECRKGADACFLLTTCREPLEIECKVLERLSRSAHKTEPYRLPRDNGRFHAFIADGINKYMGTAFTGKDFALIYSVLGNTVDRGLTIQFIESGCDMEVLAKTARKWRRKKEKGGQENDHGKA